MFIIGSRCSRRLAIVPSVRTLGMDLMVSLFSSRVEYSSDSATSGHFNHSKLLGNVLLRMVSLLGVTSAAPYGLKKLLENGENIQHLYSL